MAMAMSSLLPTTTEQEEEQRMPLLDNGGEEATAEANKQKRRRLRSLDVFRGISVALMILVDDAGGILPAINHSPWNGVTLADFVMPFFLFIVGVSLGLVYKEVPDKVTASCKVILRFLKLLILGIVLQGGYFHGVNDLTYGVNIENIRWMGIVQRIAIGYLISSLCEIWLTRDIVVDSLVGLFKKYYLQWLVAFSLSALYLGLLYGLYVPDWKFEVQIMNSSNISSITHIVKCGVRGNLGPACNAVGMIDRVVLGINHLYQKPVYRRLKECATDSPIYAPAWCQAPFDPEGLLSSVMAVLTCFIGLHFGHILVYFKAHRKRISHCTISSLVLILFGAALSIFGMPLNKPLYTLSYMCITSGASGLVFVAIYTLVDVYEYGHATMPLEWMGKNAMILYVFAACNLFLIAIQGFYWEVPQNNIVTYILQHGPWHHVGALQSPILILRSEGLHPANIPT